MSTGGVTNHQRLWPRAGAAPGAFRLVTRPPAVFLEDAYLALLRHPPDRYASRVYMYLMRRGMQPTEVLLRLRLSHEGRIQGAQLRGLAALAVFWFCSLPLRPVALGQLLGRLARFWVRRRVRARLQKTTRVAGPFQTGVAP